MSLATKLILAMIVLLAATIGAGTFYSQRALDAQARRAVEERRAEGEAAMRRQATLTLKNLTTSAALPLAENNFTYLAEMAEAARREDPNIQWLVLREAQSDKDVMTSGGAQTPSPTTSVYSADIVVGERVIGSLRLGYSTAELGRTLDASLAAARTRATQSAREQLMVAGIILLVGILLGAVQSMRMTGQLQVLNHQANLIAAGQLDQRVQVKSRDEIGQLAANFNTMAHSLTELLDRAAGKASLEREFELARGVQDLMSPPSGLVHVGPYSLSGRCDMATRCGGDWWSFRELGGGRLLVVVGDVTGHGMPSAMVAGCARGALEALRGVDDSLITPTRALEAMDNALKGLGKIDLLMTCFAIVVDPRQGVIEYANAGHCFPYLVNRKPDGALGDLAILAVRGNPLGTPARSFNTWRRPFQVGDVLVLATDGLTDRLNPRGERFGDRRYRALLNTATMSPEATGAQELRDRVYRSVDAFGEGHPADDDVTLVVCHFHGRLAAREDVQQVA